MNLIDITGKRFGKLVVLSIYPKRIRGVITWFANCKCDCGMTVNILKSSLTSSKSPTRSCGCLRKRTPKNVLTLIGKTFGKLTVVSKAKSTSKWSSMWNCVCECGKKKVVKGVNLKSGRTKSCGCHRIACTKNRNAAHLEGKRFDRLVVMRRCGSDKHQQAIWKCICDCGKFVTVKSTLLLRHRVKSCGCYSAEMTSIRSLKDLTGKKFGRLAVLKRGKNKNGVTMWKCICECGTVGNVASWSLIGGLSRSCGCYLSEWTRMMDQDPSINAKKRMAAQIRGMQMRGELNL